MIQKLKPIICFAAVLLFCTQMLAAQTSATNAVTQGRFTTDVDNYMDVNDWADVELNKWLGYLKMESIDNLSDWQGGLALKLSKLYVGFFYKGQFNSGSNFEGDITYTYQDNSIASKSGQMDLANLNPVNGLWTTAAMNSRITHSNFYSILVGMGDHGIKFSVNDRLRTTDIPYVYTEADRVIGGENIPADSEGKYWYRTGDVTPKIEWGTAKPMELGKFSAKPSASLALAVSYNNWGLDLQDSDGNVISIDNFGTATGTAITPIFGVATGDLLLWSGDWGNFYFGASDEFKLQINNEGNGKELPWENKLEPFVSFSYQPSENMGLGAKLTLPVYLGWNGTTGTFIGVGAKGTGVTRPAPLADDDLLPVLAVGFQLKGAYFESIAAKYSIVNKLVCNFGIGVNLPSYLYSGNYNYDDRDGDPEKVVIAKDNYSHKWAKHSQWLQRVSGGLALYLTPKVVFDAAYVYDGDSDLQFLISVKH